MKVYPDPDIHLTEDAKLQNRLAEPMQALVRELYRDKKRAKLA